MGNISAPTAPVRVPVAHHGRTVSGLVPWPKMSQLELGPLPTAASCARLHARNVLGEWGLPRDTIADAEVCASEIITNALRATLALADPEPIGLRLLAGPGRLVIEAWDCHPGEPARRPSDADEGHETGRGLTVIEAYSHQWGVRRLSQHVKIVWCELLLPTRI